MNSKCLIVLEVDCESNCSSPIEVIKNHEIIFKHKDCSKISSGYWPYGPTTAMRDEKVTSVEIKSIKIK